MVVGFENVLGFFNGFESGDEKSVPAGVPMILGTCWAGVLPLPFCQAFPSQALHPDAHLPPAQLPTRVYSTYHSPRHGILFESSATSPSTSPMAFYTLPSWDFSETSPPRKIFNQLPSTPALFSIFTKSYGPIASGNPF